MRLLLTTELLQIIGPVLYVDGKLPQAGAGCYLIEHIVVTQAGAVDPALDGEAKSRIESLHEP